MNQFGSGSPFLTIGRQLLAGKGNFGSFPFSQQLFNIAGNILKQKGSEFLRGMIEQPRSTDSGSKVFLGVDPQFRQSGKPQSLGQPGSGPQLRLFNGSLFMGNLRQQDQAGPAGQFGLNQENNQGGPSGDTTLEQHKELFGEEEIVQKYLQLVDQFAAKQSSFQDQLGQYRNRLAKLNVSSPQNDRRDKKARRFFFLNTPTNPGEPIRAIKEVNNWLNSAWQEMERENRALLAESRNLTVQLKP